MNCVAPIASLILVMPTISVAGTGSDCATPSLPIPDGFASGVLVDLAPAQCRDSCIVTNVVVSLEVTHEWIGDLVVTLQHMDSGTSIALLDRPGAEFIGFPGPYGCGGDDIDVVLTDVASSSSHEICSVSAVPVLTGQARPFESLSSFNGLTATSAWRLTVADDSIYDQGMLISACIDVDWALDCNGNGTPDDVDISIGQSADEDGNGIPDECQTPACPADFDGNGQVDVADFSAFLVAFGSQDSNFDLDGSGSVDIADFSAFLIAFGTTCP